MKKIADMGIWVVLLIVLVFAYRLRMDGFATTPFPGESTDEYSNAWVGMSLIGLGYPIGVGGLPTYPKHDFRYMNVDRIFSSNTVMGNATPLDYPWFDHPPMMGVVTGGFAYLKGARVFEDASTVIIRKPVIWVGMISLVLIFWLGKVALGPLSGLLAVVMMTFSPLMIMNARMVQAENFIVPLFLAAVLALYYYLGKGWRNGLYLAAACAGVGLLFKLSAVAIVLAVVLLILTDEKKLKEKIRDVFIFLLIASGFLSMYFVIGLVYDWPLFLKTILGNTNRNYGIGFHSIFELLTITKITGKIYLTDGWPLFGWLGVAYLFTSKLKRAKYILIPLISYLCIYIFFGSESFGWYRIPVFPFVYLAGAYLLSRGINKAKTVIPAILFLLIPMGVGLEKLAGVDKLDMPTNWWRMGVPAVLLLITVIFYSGKSRLAKNISKTIAMLMFLLALWISYRYIGIIDANYWFRVN